MIEKTLRIIILPISTIIAISILSPYLIFAHATTTENYSFIKGWGTQGAADGQFVRPTGIAIDNSSNNVFVLDSGNNRVQVFDTHGKFIAKWGSKGSGDGQFDSPSGISIDPVGNIYITDSGNSRIEKFTSDGSFLTQWKTGSDSSANPSYLSGISISPSGNVYYTSTLSDEFIKDSTDGKELLKFGSNGLGDGQFSFPTSIVNNGFIYIFDNNNHRIQKFVEFETGTYPPTSVRVVAKWGHQGTGDGQFTRSAGIAVDASGNVYVADMGNHRIQKFDSNGGFITKWGVSGIDQGKFSSPIGIAVDVSGNVYVADMTNNNIQVFAQTS